MSQKKQLPAYRVTLLYTIHDNGDGSHFVRFHANKEAAELYKADEKLGGESNYEDIELHEEELLFDVSGRLLVDSSQTEYILEELKEKRADAKGKVKDEIDNAIATHQKSKPEILLSPVRSVAAPKPKKPKRGGYGSGGSCLKK